MLQAITQPSCRPNPEKGILNELMKVATSMIDRDEFNACVSTARHEGEAKGEAKANKRFAAREKKIAKYLRSHGVSAQLLNAALAIK